MRAGREDQMSRCFVWLLAGIVAYGISTFDCSSHAWEFSMGGSFSWEYETAGQLGRNGLFGTYDVDAGSGVAPVGTFAPLNAWLGIQAKNIVSGSDAAWQTIYMTTDMTLKINRALRIRGQYYIGTWTDNGDGTGSGSLVASEYLNSSLQGIQQSFSPGYWNTLWMTAQLP